MPNHHHVDQRRPNIVMQHDHANREIYIRDFYTKNLVLLLVLLPLELLITQEKGFPLEILYEIVSLTLMHTCMYPAMVERILI